MGRDTSQALRTVFTHSSEVAEPPEVSGEGMGEVEEVEEVEVMEEVEEVEKEEVEELHKVEEVEEVGAPVPLQLAEAREEVSSTWMASRGQPRA